MDCNNSDFVIFAQFLINLNILLNKNTYIVDTHNALSISLCINKIKFLSFYVNLFRFFTFLTCLFKFNTLL